MRQQVPATRKLAQNTPRQPERSSAKPPSDGPASCPAAVNDASTPMICPRRSGRADAAPIAMPSDIDIATPIAVTTRAASSTTNVGDSAATPENTQYRNMPSR